MESSYLIVAFGLLIAIFDTLLFSYLIKIQMANNTQNNESGGIGGFLLGIAAIIGGAFVTSYLIDKFSEKKVKYSCPNCNSDIDYKQDECHVCHSKLKWDF